MNKRYDCCDCGAVLPAMVVLHDPLWLSIANKKDVLCFTCIETRLGRDITFDDLKPCVVTEGMRLGALMAEREKLIKVVAPLKRRLEIQQRAIDHYLPCPDCRDKVKAGECQRCLRQAAENKVEEFKRQIGNLWK